MIRETLGPGSAHVMLDVRPGGALEFMTRRTTGGMTTFLAGGTRPPPAWLKLRRSGSTIAASVSIDGQTWTVVGTTTTTLSATALIGFLVCSHDTAELNAAAFDGVAVSSGVPSPWTSSDIGVTGVSGSTSFADGRFTARGAGADIWGSADSFHYVYRPVGGDGQIIARLASLQNTHAFAKAGVMIRASPAANAAHVVLDVRPGGGVEFMTRRTTGGITTFLAGGSRPPPAFLKLQRSGSTVTASVSIDGQNWTTVGSTTTTLSSSALIGFFVCSHDGGQLNTAVFDGVSVSSASLTLTARLP
jgi:regulation of enolase protein 1 (concanavalin A-like superfamily)